MAHDRGQRPHADGGYGYNPGGAPTGYSYGGGYGGYGYGYGDAEGRSQVQRTLQDYLLILRERVWYVVVVFLVIVASTLVYTLSDTKIYQSSATLQIFRRDPQVMQVQQVMENDIRSQEDFNTQVKVIESLAIIDRVAKRITGDTLRDFLAPFEKTSADAAFVADLVAKNRRVIPQRLTLVVAVSFQHPNRFVAAKVANLFAEEYRNYNQHLRAEAQDKAGEDLQRAVEDQRKKVDELALKRQRYKEKNGTVSLDQRKDIVSESLKAINLEVQRSQGVLQGAETRVDQIKDYRARGADLVDLPFVSASPLINELKQHAAVQKIQLAKVAERYLDKHPTMIEARNAYSQTMRELQRQIDSVCAQHEADYEAAKKTHALRVAELERIKAESLAVDAAAVEYDQIDRDVKTQELILQSIAARKTETAMSSNIETRNARIVDLAVPSPAERPISPNLMLNLGLGVMGGLGLGLAFAFFVAFIDDRVKSSFDIEGVVGLPLIGIIPEIKKLDLAQKAQIVATNDDRQVAEAFLTLHSSLRLKDESKNAKCILITSTIPGEGKSFTTTNLALTFAAHGEKVVVVDCDLRKPNIHKSFRLENLKGVIDVCAGHATLDEAVIRGVQPNLDVLASGGRAKNPTQVLNSRGFEVMISELRKRYDRVFVDTPPLAAVSDALIVLPLVDGSIFTIFFNKVRRKAAQFGAKKLLEANVPNFGAVLNGLNLAVSGYYYAQYYDKSYKDYYVVQSRDDGLGKEK
ncbi:MAG: polysaccharide biosynthesis tyrosine autokinase [Opitutaceae bacterium]|nr:polysaccharide biosynthesis tyrosine autokinase [Opitutaceae bacterium]